MDGRSNSYLFTNIKMFAYIRPVQCNTQIINGSKYPAKGFGLFITAPPKNKHSYTTMDIILYVIESTKQNHSNLTQKLH